MNFFVVLIADPLQGRKPVVPRPYRRRSSAASSLAADELLDELPSPTAHLGLDRIDPIIKKAGSRLGFKRQGIWLHGNACHGVSPLRRFNAG
jgi:hypothetical protein